MRSLISRLFRKKTGIMAVPPDPKPYDLPLTPELRFAAIGDVHGNDSLLAALLDRLEAEEPGLPHLYLGDVIDRGPDSAGVLRRLMALQDNAAFLRGNHETMMLDFLDDPAGRGGNWLINGGTATLESFGIAAPDPRADLEELDAASAALHRALGPDMITWLRDWPVWLGSGNIVCAHAGFDPTRHPTDQSERAPVWGDPAFLKAARSDDLWIVHGHWITPDPRPGNSRIPVDTGAYATGILTAAVIEPGRMRYISVGP